MLLSAVTANAQPAALTLNNTCCAAAAVVACLVQVNEAAEIIYDLVDPDANLIFGAVIDPSMQDEVSITLIATGRCD